MKTLLVIAYDDMFKAEEVRLTLQKMRLSYLVDVEDAVVAVKDENEKVKLHQMHNLTAAGASAGGFWGALVGLIFLNPLLGLAVGASAGAISGALSDVGINDAFMKELTQTLQPGSSALFVLERGDATRNEKVLAQLAGTGGKVLQTSLSHDDEKRLQEALDGHRAAGDGA